MASVLMVGRQVVNTAKKFYSHHNRVWGETRNLTELDALAPRFILCDDTKVMQIPRKPFKSWQVFILFTWLYLQYKACKKYKNLSMYKLDWGEYCAEDKLKG